MMRLVSCEIVSVKVKHKDEVNELTALDRRCQVRPGGWLYPIPGGVLSVVWWGRDIVQ